MPWLISSLGGLLAIISANLVAKVLVSLGMSVITFVGMGFLIRDILAIIQENVFAIPAVALQTMALVKLDVAINIVFSAALIKLGQFGVNGLISKINFNPPSV